MYKRIHVCDIVIDDEQLSNGREISVFVDTEEMVNIEFGNSMVIRTNENGLDDLRDILHKASQSLEEARYYRISREEASLDEKDSTSDSSASLKENGKQRKRSEQQLVDPYSHLANDPAKW